LINKRKLSVLGLSNNRLKEEGAVEILSKGVVDKPLLTKLSMEGTMMGSNGLLALSRSLLHNTELMYLFLYNNAIENTGATMEEFSRMLENKFGLVTLGLEFNHIDSAGAILIMNSLSKGHTNLEKVYLSQNSIDHEFATSLIATLPKFESLKELRMSNNKLGDEGGEILAKALTGSKTLTCVNVSGNKFSVKSSLAFANFIKKNKILKDLDLSHNLIIMEEL
jgi:Ran GTPase-activating protein (RanGAP) involved in mRNA processing and transport